VSALAVMTPLDCAQVRLAAAVLCQDCDTISDTPHPHCPACGSQSLLLLARVLNRKESCSQESRDLP
jgi:rRNA maturation endonuclease Nob1